MRRLILAAAGLAALLTASIAFAHGFDGAHGVRGVAATFTANAAKTSTKTCTTSDGKSISITTGQYTGTATGDPDLTGPITIRAESVVNTTDGVGVVSGLFRIAVAGNHNSVSAFSSVWDHGALAGFAGGAGFGFSFKGRLFANLSATFNPATGFTTGKLGGGTTGGSAVEMTDGHCSNGDTPKPEKSEARGTISALSTSSITVAGLTCAINPGDAADVNAKYKVGDTVAIECSLASGANTLDKIGDGGKGDGGKEKGKDHR